MHIRQQIRGQLETIIGAITDFGGRVDSQRVIPVVTADLPMVTIKVLGESVRQNNLGFPRIQDRTMTVSVRVFCAAGSDAVDVLDALCVKVEAALFLNSATCTLNGKAKLMTLNSVSISHVATGEMEWSVADHTIAVNAMTLENDPSTGL